MRFEISRALDAIEARLTLDPALARATLDLAEVVRLVDLDGAAGKPASLLRLGRVIDVLGQHLAEGDCGVFAVADRSLLADLDLTSNERMVVRRWADDGLVEVLPAVDDRVLEVAGMLGLPVLTRRPYTEFADRHPWVPEGLLAPTAGGLAPAGSAPAAPAAPSAVLTRLWQCPEADCAVFGAPAGGQPPPRMRAGVPTCPRHEVRLADAGARPPARVLAIGVDGAVRRRVVVREGAPVVVGRAPGGGGVELGPWLNERALRWISRSHLRLELRGESLTVTDTSTNGTAVQARGGPVPLAADQPYALAGDDIVELYDGVRIGRPDRLGRSTFQPSSVLADAPTVALRLPL